MFRRMALLSIAALMAFGFVAESRGALMTYGFRGVTDDASISDDTNISTGESQMFVQVTDAGLPTDQVRFAFFNWFGLTQSSLTDIYFDDGAITNFNGHYIESGSGTDFGIGATPGELPGPFSPPGFEWNQDGGPHVAADANGTTNSAAELANGVNPYEYVSIVVQLDTGKTWADVIAAINLGLVSPNLDVAGGLRIGIHVKGFGDGGRESFVNTGAVADDLPVLPEPASMVAWGLGLAMFGGVGYWGKRRKNVAA